MFELDSERQKLARSFSRSNFWIGICSWMLLFVYVGLWMFFEAKSYPNNHLVKFLSLNSSYIFVLFVFYSGYIVLQLPIGFIFSIWLPRLYGFSVERTSNWVMKYGFSSILFIGRDLLIVSFLLVGTNKYLLGESLSALLFWFVICSPFFSLDNFFKTIFWITTPLNKVNPELDKDLRDLCEHLKFKVKEILVYDDGNDLLNSNAHAFLGKSKIALGSQLLKHLSNNEIKAVASHELGHLKIGLGLKFPKLFNFFVLCIYRPGLFYLIVVGTSFALKLLSISSINAYWVPILYIISILFRLVSSLIYIPVFRNLEFKADDFAVLTSGKETYISSMLRLADMTLYHYSPRWKSSLTYPSLYERIERIKLLNGE